MRPHVDPSTSCKVQIWLNDPGLAG